MNVIDEIDAALDIAEVDVLRSICESYQKALDIMINNDDTMNVFFESHLLIMESDDNKSKSSSIKNLLSKVFNFFKSVINKITTHFKKILERKKDITYVANCLRILEYAKHMDKPTTVTQESFFGGNDEKKEALKRVKEQKKTTKSVNKDTKGMAKDIKKSFNKSNLYYDLSVNDIKTIVENVTSDMTDSEFKKFKQLINDAEVELKDVDKKYEKKVKQIISMSKYMNDANKTLTSIKADFNINKKLSKDSGKVERDLNVLKNMADSFGKTLNDMGNTSVFEFDNIKNIAYGGHPVKGTLGAIANWFVGCLKNIPDLLKNAAEYERQLYDTHHAMTNYFDTDNEERKELGIKTNKILQGTMFMLDNIKEETYGWEDDLFYNAQSYRGNGLTLMLGGPFTTTFKAINYLITRDPSVILESVIMDDDMTTGIADVNENKDIDEVNK